MLPHVTLPEAAVTPLAELQDQRLRNVALQLESASLPKPTSTTAARRKFEHVISKGSMTDRLFHLGTRGLAKSVS
jgi:hypothetical protein